MELMLVCFCFMLVSGNERVLPSWIAENSAFQSPQRINSLNSGRGSISFRGRGTAGWLVNLNEKPGHGIEIDVIVEDFNPDSNDFLLISGWPLTGKHTQIKLITGKKVSKKFRIPNTRDFFVLYETTSSTSAMLDLSYNRYGSSFELNQPSTENPIKKKETIYEIQLRGKSPDSYRDPAFLGDFKKALRTVARRYCTLHGISFDDTISIDEMIRILKVSFCPFEWPDRSICASIEHSIFVSGVRLSHDDLVLDYQLTADHLKKMWAEDSLEEINALSVTVFVLPSASNVVFYWTVILGLVIVSSLLGTYVFWKTNQINDLSLRKSPVSVEETKKPVKAKLKLMKHEKIPSFMFDTENSKSSDMEKFASSTVESEGSSDFFKSKSKPESPIKNYLGSILFNSNRAFENDDEDDDANDKKFKNT